jgi:hypothetical protein
MALTDVACGRIPTGIQAFGINDPWHFGSLHEAMITLFRVATLDDWETIMRINVYGCDTDSVRIGCSFVGC